MEHIADSIWGQWGAFGLFVGLALTVIIVLYKENVQLRRRNSALTERIIAVAETSRSAIETWTKILESMRR